jgi:hypothetical protein
MPSQFIDRISTLRAARISLALLLAVLLVFPTGLLAQDPATQCNSTNWTAFPFKLPNSIETLNAVVNNGYLYVVGGSTGISGFSEHG